ncbi:unnamed protein product [Owenia fusiformis]|uniref:Uncharacterized protein n=1 Tax=Owenia fusiformis TaxID=6347 RepID=A0A8S4P2A7_OWEFU|nr:unnamed protein product [Owenia fusiformis]
MPSHRDLECKVYVGNLDKYATKEDVEMVFRRYGDIANVWVARSPPGFAFVEYHDERDAKDAVRGLDGEMLKGARIRVEISNGRIRPKPWLRGGDGDRRGGRRGGRRPFNSDDTCYVCGKHGHYAYDCTRSGGSRSHQSGGRRSSHYSRSRSRSPRRRSYSRSRSRSRDRSDRYSRDRSRDKSRSRSRSRSHSHYKRRSHSGSDKD